MFSDFIEIIVCACIRMSLTNTKARNMSQNCQKPKTIPKLSISRRTKVLASMFNLDSAFKEICIYQIRDASVNGFVCCCWIRTTSEKKTKHRKGMTNPMILNPRHSNHGREQLAFGFFVGMFFVLAINHSWSWMLVWKSSVKSGDSYSGRPKVVLIGDSITEYGFSHDGKIAKYRRELWGGHKLFGTILKLDESYSLDTNYQLQGVGRQCWATT